MKVEPLTSLDSAGWLALRRELWPDTPVDAHREEMRRFVAEPRRYVQYIVRSAGEQALGFAEASLRNDYVAGTSSSPVCFLEGLYVVPGARRQGIARLLVQAVAAWGAQRGCAEFASDTEIDNTLSQRVHRRLGFRETERIVCFNMPLPPKDAAS